ncbi:hypothetical protein SEA_NOSHOW_28 [Mycobacterium phage NoShow]|nr:hypothetical protein SEA_NOSHOW_28 [Mycobacterium phage NoShow]
MGAYTKAILAFLSLLATNVATEVTQDGVVFPTDGGEWARWAISIIGGTWLVYQLPNNRATLPPR